MCEETAASMERSAGFVTALQELKNLKPHLHSAAKYCQRSYINSEQKQMILDSLKDYAAQALVNTIDHLGTVAYKLNDILEQQTEEISSIDLRVVCLNQKLLTCQTYTDNEGLRQQQLLAIIPRHHKHYTLPNPVNKKVHFSRHTQSDSKLRIQVRGHLYPSGASAARTLSWHLASETKSTLKGSSRGIISIEETKLNGKTSRLFKPSDTQWTNRMRSTPATKEAMQTLGVSRRITSKLRDSLDGSKPALTSHTAQKKCITDHNKNMFSGIFLKHKASKSRKNT